MKTDPNIGFACTEEFGELCALSTTGALSAEEYKLLETHVAVCQKCKNLLADYQSLALDGMAKIAAQSSADLPVPEMEAGWFPAEAKSRLLATLKAREPSQIPETSPVVRQGRDTRPVPASGFRRELVAGLGIAAVLVFGLLAGYQFGLKKNAAKQTSRGDSASSVEQQLRAVETQRDALNAELAASAKTVGDLTDRAKRSEAELAELKIQKASLEAEAQQSNATNKEQSDSLAAFAGQREALERRLAETEESLKNVKQDLNAVQDERRKAQLRTASLETTIDDLSARLNERTETAKRDEEFLASDRDVRELMGARQLYIADVFDVDQNGKKRTSFGRVFYTKGKSLIFYAFDLDQQPAYRDAKAPASKTFQVWGSAGQDNAKPFGLGVFYMDSEANRRWVFKSDDPNVLAQVNAVFVTVESKDGSKTPSGKPFLYAYLRTAPANHP